MKFVDSWGSLVLDHVGVACSTFIIGDSMQTANFKANERLASILERIGSRPSAVNSKGFYPVNCLWVAPHTDSKKELMELDFEREVGGSQTLDQLAQSGTPLVDKLHWIHRWGVHTVNPRDVPRMRLMEISFGEVALQKFEGNARGLGMGNERL